VSTLRQQSFFKPAEERAASRQTLLPDAAGAPDAERRKSSVAVVGGAKDRGPATIHFTDGKGKFTREATNELENATRRKKKLVHRSTLKVAPLRSLQRFSTSELDPLEMQVRRCAKAHKIPLNDAELIVQVYKRYDDDGSGQCEYNEFREIFLALSTSSVSENAIKSYWQRFPKPEPEEGEEPFITLDTFLPWYYKNFGSPANKEKSPKSAKKKKKS
jgi:hypothetical protein